MEALTQNVIMNQLLPDVVARLCLVSVPFRSACLEYLQSRIRRELKDSTIKLNPLNPAADYVKVMTLSDPDFLMRGSEQYLGLDEAIFRAAKLDNIELLSYLLAQSPACESRQLRLAAVSAAMLGSIKVLRDILQRCNFDIRFARILDSLAREYGDQAMVDEINLPMGFQSSSPEADILVYVGDEGYLPIAKYILEHGFKGSLFKNTQRKANILLEHASGAGHLEMVKYLIRGRGMLDIRDALLRALHEKRNDVVKYLAELGTAHV